MQEGYIFNDIISKIICLNEEEIDAERIHNALKTANIHGFVISLPLGLNTIIGSEGTSITTGQKQRILIASAIYKQAELILFPVL